MNMMNVIEKTEIQFQPLELQAHLFKILALPARIAILYLLRDGEHCVCHMEAYLGFRQSYISQQLGVLREAGLILDRRDGWNIYYRVVNPQIYEVLDTVQRITGQTTVNYFQSDVICECPHCSAKRAHS
jgi:DNA-binding transcriptional ArsR family regulator